MSFSTENGYVPSSITDLIAVVRVNINDQFGTTYTAESFVGTNFYKYFYAIIQKLQENEVKTSEIVQKLQDYFRITNERILRPVVTNPGLIEAFAGEGYIASVKKPVDLDAGKVFICIDKDIEGTDLWEDSDDYAADKLVVAGLIKDWTIAGVVTQGTESESVALSNGQTFDFKYNLPARVEVLLRLTITVSDNNQVVISPPEDSKQILIDNIEAEYSLGKDFEPQRYFSISDAPWASSILLEWSDDDGGNWHDEVFEAEYDDFFTILLENIELVEA